MSFARYAWWLVVGVSLFSRPASAQPLAWSWSNPQPHGNDIVDLAWNGTLGVQVGDCGQVYTSPDLIKWTPQNSHLTNSLQAVTFFGRRIIITGASGAVAYSDDGTNFTASSLNNTNWIVSVAASPKLVVAVGDSGVIYTSTDGAKWSLQPPPPNVSDNWLNSVAYGNGVFVTVGDNGYIATSSNGTNWSSGSSLDENQYGDLENVTWSIGSGSTTTFPYTGFYLVTDNYTDTGYSYALYSVNNGANWAQVNFDAYQSNVFYTAAVGSANALLAGDDTARLGAPVDRTVTWPEQIGSATNTVPPWIYFTSVSPSNGVYELAGTDGMLVESYPTNSSYAWDEPYFSARDWLFEVTVANGLYVAVGDNTRIMTSVDGAEWSVEEVPPGNSITNTTSTVLLCVGGTTNLLLAAGTSGSLAVSPFNLLPTLTTNLDGSVSTNEVSALGLDWYPQRAPTGTTNDLAGLGTFNQKFYLVGGNGTLLSSVDGTNWAKLNSGTANYLSGITTFTNALITNGLLVLSGNEGTLLTSTNGTNWASHPTGTTNWLYRTHAFNGRLLSVGENGVMLASTNGANWVGLTSGVTNWLNDAILVGQTCYVIGNQGVVLASTNFLTATTLANIIWNNAGSITTKALECAATQNGQLLVVGFEGSILRSQIIPQPVNFLQYAQSDGYNLWSVAGALNQQFTLDSSTNLLNWVTGPELQLIYGDGTLVFYQALPTNHPPASQSYRCTLVP